MRTPYTYASLVRALDGDSRSSHLTMLMQLQVSRWILTDPFAQGFPDIRPNGHLQRSMPIQRESHYFDRIDLETSPIIEAQI